MRSLANLQTDQLDTLLIHFPGAPDAVQARGARIAPLMTSDNL